jgi:hypothetical protein
VVGGDSDVRHSLIATVAENLKQRYFDRATGRQLAGALLAYARDGRYDPVSTGAEVAERITADIYRTSRAIGIPAGAFVADVVLIDRPPPVGPPPLMTAELRERNRARIVAQNCLFETVETWPHGIAYVKLNGFGEASACQEITNRTMTRVNSAAALILDLRDNGGGFGETALQKSQATSSTARHTCTIRAHTPGFGRTPHRQFLETSSPTNRSMWSRRLERSQPPSTSPTT